MAGAGLLIQQRCQAGALRGMPQLLEGLLFYLPDAFPAQAQLLADGVQGMRCVAPDTVAQAQDLRLPWGQFRQDAVHALHQLRLHQ